MNLRSLLLGALVATTAAFAQSSATLDTPYQVAYAANLDYTDTLFNITNTGARGAGLAPGISASTTGAICVNVYAFSPDEQILACCSCPVTPNGLVSLSARRDLIANTLQISYPVSMVTKFVATTPVGGSCAASASAPGPLSSGLVVWFAGGLPTGPLAICPNLTNRTGCRCDASTGFQTICARGESAAVSSTLSTGELTRLTALCAFINANGNGFGICRSCRLGGQGAEAR